MQTIRARNPKAIILSGGPSSVRTKASPRLAKAILEMDIPILGICYGMQLMSYLGQGRIVSGKSREYGASQITILNNQSLFDGFKANEKVPVWMSHGDSVAELPAGAIALAESERCVVAFQKDNLFGVQFHPEVAHTPIGQKVIGNFLFKIAGLKANWKVENFLEKSAEGIRQKVLKSKVIGGVSGGVDSTIMAVFLGKILPKQFIPVLIDNGLLRHEEAKQVKSALKECGVRLEVVDAAQLFLRRLKGVTDPEKKRRIIGRTFIEVFDNHCRKHQGVSFLAQGTLYPDVIESVSVMGPSHTIKTHHNVGGLPKKMRLALIEPFRELFKDEVRVLGRDLGVPSEMVDRHPFPGPGLAVRILGEVTPKRLSLLRQADQIYLDELKRSGLYSKIWQAFAVLLPVSAVGVMGDSRTYESVLALRAVTSRDGMTADWFDFEKSDLARISNRIINEVPGINRVVYDISSKPPATIEWE